MKYGLSYLYIKYKTIKLNKNKINNLYLDLSIHFLKKILKIL